MSNPKNIKLTVKSGGVSYFFNIDNIPDDDHIAIDVDIPASDQDAHEPVHITPRQPEGSLPDAFSSILHELDAPGTKQRPPKRKDWYKFVEDRVKPNISQEQKDQYIVIIEMLCDLFNKMRYYIKREYKQLLRTITSMVNIYGIKAMQMVTTKDFEKFIDISYAFIEHLRQMNNSIASDNLRDLIKILLL
jgi:hypothetical protein